MKPRKQKPRKLRLLSSTKGEENRIETTLNQKSLKSKNACILLLSKVCSKMDLSSDIHGTVTRGTN